MSDSNESSHLTKCETYEKVKKCDEDTNDHSSVEKRQTWSRKTEFILALVGYSVGLGNVWRFPYLCYKNGGGAFLIPYVIFVVIAGIPMFFLEISLGQYTRQTALGVWKLVPSMKGIGYGCAIINFMAGIYYVLVMAWAALYLVHSCLPGPLPWTTCGNWWNTKNCTNHWEKLNLFRNASTNETLSNVSSSAVVSEGTTSPEAEFWTNYVLRQSTGIDEIGGMGNWPLILCFIASWLVIYFCIFKGVRSSGKIVYVSALLPYVMLLILLVRGLTLDGAIDGVVYLLNPNFTKLSEPQVWMDAGGQIFFSYGICFTVLMTFGSYNKFNNNCYKQAIFLAATCSLTSLLASFAIFSVLGHMAFVGSKNISDVATQGPGLIFEVYPIGLSLLPWPKFWSILFFIGLFLLGIDTQFAGVEGVVAAFVERFPFLEKGKYGTEKASALISLGLLVLGLPLLAEGGVYLFELFNMYAVSGICLLFMTFFESIAIGWIYGVDRYYDNVKEMIGYYPSLYFKLCYRFVTPTLALVIFTFYCVKYAPLMIDQYTYPPWANAVGWLMSLASMLCVPGMFIWHLWRSEGTLYERFIEALRPNASTTITDSISEKI